MNRVAWFVCLVFVCVSPCVSGYGDDEGEERRPSFQNFKQFRAVYEGALPGAGLHWEPCPGNPRLYCIVDDPEPVGVREPRFTQDELEIIERAAQRANPDYPRMGAVIPALDRYVLDFTPAVFSNGLSPWSACDSDQQCADDTDPLCMEHNGTHSDPDTAEVQTNPETGDQVCSADCEGGGTAVIACNRTIIDDPDPTGHDRGGNRDLADDH